MHILGLVIIAIALLIFPLAWRGRIVGRGQYCRKCKFDLTGSPIDTQGNKCPECGQPIHIQSARRTTIRRSSRPGFIIVAVLLLIGITSTIIGITGNSAAIYAKMPDGIIVRLSTMGFDDALDDLVLRLTRTQPLSDSHWDNLISNALSHQADTTARWDLRWGEVLYHATVDGRLNGNQFKQYALNGFKHSVRIRDRVHQGTQGVGYQIVSSQKRLSGLTGGNLGYTVSLTVNQSGVVGKVPKYKEMGGGIKQSFEFKVPKDGQNWTRTMSSRIQTVFTRPMFNVEPGSAVEVYVDYEVKLTQISNGSTIFVEPFRQEQTIIVLSRDTPIVQTVTPTADQLITCGHSLSPINLISPLPETIPTYGLPIMTAHISLEKMTEPVAFRAYFLLDGKEVEFGTMSGIGNPALTSIYIVQWSINQSDRETAQSTIDQLIEQGQVDIIFRTDPNIAIDNPDINQVLGLTLRFNDVPINIVLSDSAVWSVQQGLTIDASCESN